MDWNKTPQQCKFEFGLSALTLMRELINRQFGKSLSLESVGRVMKLPGFSVQKSLYQAWQQDRLLELFHLPPYSPHLNPGDQVGHT